MGLKVVGEETQRLNTPFKKYHQLKLCMYENNQL